MTKNIITLDQIKALRTEAGEHGDLECVAICDRALAGDAEAVAQCEKFIRDAAAMDDGEVQS